MLNPLSLSSPVLRALITVLCGLIFLPLAGCSASKGEPRPFRSYLVDRGRDFGDILTLSGGFGIGGKIAVGPAYANTLVYYQEDRMGWRQGGLIPRAKYDIGSAGLDTGAWLFSGESFYTPTPIQRRRGKLYVYGSTRKPFLMIPNEGAGAAAWAQIEVAAGIGPALRIGANPLELLDFLCGLVAIDLLGDDVAGLPEAETPELESPVEKERRRARRKRLKNSRGLGANQTSTVHEGTADTPEP